MADNIRVRREPDGYIVICVADGEYVFKPADHGDALRWIEHISRKQWATPKVLGEVARLYANGAGVRYR